MHGDAIVAVAPPIVGDVQRWPDLVVPGLWAILVCGVILAGAAEPTHDQRYLLERSIQTWWHPLDSGISSRWLAGVLGLGTTDLLLHSLALRCATAMLSIGAVAWALWSAPRVVAWLGLAVFVTSGAPLVWVSGDLIAAAGVALVWTTRGAAWASWLLWFARPDLWLPGLALSLSWARTRSMVLALLAVLAGTMAYAALSDEATGRATLSFWQHYQFLRTGDMGEFAEWTIHRDAEFGQDATVTQILQTHPIQYVWFLWRSLLMSTWNLCRSGLVMLLPTIVWAAWLHRRERHVRGAVAFVVINLAIITVLSFCHVRYQSRFLVLALLVIAQAWPSAPERFRTLGLVSLVALLSYQMLDFPTWAREGIFVVD